MVRKKNAGKPGEGQRIGRIFIVLIGLMFIGWGVLSVGLGLFGDVTDRPYGAI